MHFSNDFTSDFTTTYWRQFNHLWSCFLDYTATQSSDATWAALFSEKNKRAMITNFSQLQLSFNDVDQHPGICKGQLSAETPIRTTTSTWITQRNKPLRCPWSLFKEQWVGSLLSTQSDWEDNASSLSQRTKARSYSVPLNSLPLSHLDCMHHGGLCHKSSTTRPS